MGLSTGVLRPAILRVANHPWAQRFATHSRLGRAVADRFVAGETLADALAAARELAPDGISVMLNHLGENVTTLQEALAEREAYLAEIAAAAASVLSSASRSRAMPGWASCPQWAASR